MVPLRGRPLLQGLAALLLTLLLAAVAACFVEVPYYAITPGQAIEVAAMVTVPKGRAHHHQGKVLMTDVDLVSLRAIDYLYYLWSSDDQVVPSDQLIGSATPAQYAEQGAVDMHNARQAATVAALSTLGYPVRAVPSGVIVYQPLPGSPAGRHLSVGQVISEVDGEATPTLAALAKVVGPLHPGEPVTLSVGRLGRGPGRHPVRLDLGEYRGSGSALTCLVAGARAGLAAPPASRRRAGCIGVVGEQAYESSGLPFKVSIDSRGIIGPSAGLAFTLGLLQVLDPVDLTGGQRVAATGTMSVDGQVGDVGGVAQKTVAVRNAGATVFFVPPEEYRVAKAHAGPHLRVEAVSTLHQAVADLEALGGRLVARNGR